MFLTRTACLKITPANGCYGPWPGWAVSVFPLTKQLALPSHQGGFQRVSSHRASTIADCEEEVKGQVCLRMSLKDSKNCSFILSQPWSTRLLNSLRDFHSVDRENSCSPVFQAVAGKHCEDWKCDRTSHGTDSIFVSRMASLCQPRPFSPIHMENFQRKIANPRREVDTRHLNEFGN